MRAMLPLALALTLVTAGCATSPLFGGPNAFCSIAEPITWSSKDSDATLTQVKSHNSVGKALCGWKGKK